MWLECCEQQKTIGEEVLTDWNQVQQGLEGHGQESDFIPRAVASH